MTADDFVAEHFRKGFPWCDTCKQPAVFSEFFGLRHVTPEHPSGVPDHRDTSGHLVTMREWWITPDATHPDTRPPAVGAS